MAYIIIRGSEKQGGYVSMVEKGRIDGEVRTKAYICGLGAMTMEEFKTFQKWAHSFKDQEERKAMVLASGKAITEKEEIPQRAKAAKKSIEIQKMIKRKMVKKTTKAEKKKVRKHYPVPEMAGYKGALRGKTHTEMMMAKEKEYKEVRRQEVIKAKYKAMSETERKARIKELENKKRLLRKEWRHWDAIISEGGLYASKHERAQRAMIEQKTKAIDVEIKRLKGWR